MTTQPVHVTFIHGLANKPRPSELRRIWLQALRMPTANDSGLDLGGAGVSDTFIYWSDLFYDQPLPASDYETLYDELKQGLDNSPIAPPTNTWIEAMRKRYPEAGDTSQDPPTDPALSGYERIPLPGFLKNQIMAEFLRESHDYLFNVSGIRDTIRARVIEDLSRQPAGTQRVLVSHSQGTFIAYDVMTGVDACPPIDGFMTFGSPLGIDEVQDRLMWTRDQGFPSKLRGDWVNVFDPFDLIARPDPRLANDFLKAGTEVVIDIEESNWGRWRHSATKYLQGKQLRAQLRRLCGREGA